MIAISVVGYQCALCARAQIRCLTALTMEMCSICILLWFLATVESRHRDRRQASEEMDLIGVRIDTPHSVADYEINGLLIVKPYQNVTVRLFGTKLHELKTVKVTDSLYSCSLEATIQQPIMSESFLELSPNTATFTFKFPHHTTTYCFCFQWKRHVGDPEGTFYHQGDQGYSCVATARKSWTV